MSTPGEGVLNLTGAANGKVAGEESVTGGFSFTKVAADNTTTVGGAVFVIKNSNNEYGLYKDNSWTWTNTQPDANKVPANDADRKAGGFFVSGANLGSVQVDGLADGTYTVEEIKAPNDYMQTALASFTVTLKDGKVTGFSGTDKWGLAPKPNNGETITSGYKVKNVKSITQLPLTGAAGTILFSAVGVILAAAAGTVFLKSRSTKRALRA